MTSHGLEAADVPKALILHEMLGFTMLAITWTFCYYFPLKRIPFFAKQLNKFPTMQSFSKSGTMTSVMNALSSRRGVAYLESSCLRKIIRPATIPAKMWVVFMILKSFKEPVLSEEKGTGRIVAPRPVSIKNICDAAASGNRLHTF